MTGGTIASHDCHWLPLQHRRVATSGRTQACLARLGKVSSFNALGWVAVLASLIGRAAASGRAGRCSPCYSKAEQAKNRDLLSTLARSIANRVVLQSAWQNCDMACRNLPVSRGNIGLVRSRYAWTRIAFPFISGCRFYSTRSAR